MRAYPSDRFGRATEPARKRKRQRSRNNVVQRIVRLLVIVAIGLIAVSILLVLPLRWIDPATTAFMIGDEQDLDTLRFEWVPWDRIAEPLALAVIASEDQRFFEHAGIDVDSIRKSVEESRRGEGLRGASTITQQVAKNLYLWRGRSFVRKGIEAYLAVLVDLLWPKRRILEVYLNVAEFGPGTYGVAAASEVFFGKPASAIGDAEAALLAAVLPNPARLQAGAPSDYVRERQRWIMGQMQRLRREQVMNEVAR